MGLWWLCSLKHVTWQKNLKQKLKITSILLGADHIFGPVIQIRKDLGHMYFWSRGQSISLMLNYFNIMTQATPGTPAIMIYKLTHGLFESTYLIIQKGRSFKAHRNVVNYKIS
jgi:hypothetical protein